MFKNKRVGVLMGGLSAEREISLVSGEAVLAALRARGYQAEGLIADSQVDRVLRAAAVDVVFLALHGRWGEDGCVQGLLELMGIPYTGSGVLASALAMHKVKAKEIFRLHNLPTPPYYVLPADQIDQLATLHGSFGFPVVVKPAGEGSSLGVSIAHDLEELQAACQRAAQLDHCLLVERYITGKEVCVGILNGRPLGAIGIVSHNQLFDFEAKYTAGQAHFHVPAKLSAERYRGVLTQAQRAHQALGCSGATRVDMIVSDLGNEYVLEVNTLPGLTPRSLLPRLADHAGLSYADLVEEILGSAALRTGAQLRRTDAPATETAPVVPVRRASAAARA
ncbi:MAG: D-alanine--D-alanine ligase [Proteobacteria bacterium]|jgi:D-alanine-D-alanine ligase|nr:D-alanine--D-alanine ligase [Pseudomonadota bacterium]